MKIVNAKGITLFESANWGGWKLVKDGHSTTIRASKVCAGVIEVRKIEMESARSERKRI